MEDRQEKGGGAMTQAQCEKEAIFINLERGRHTVHFW